MRGEQAFAQAQPDAYQQCSRRVRTNHEETIDVPPSASVHAAPTASGEIRDERIDLFEIHAHRLVPTVVGRKPGSGQVHFAARRLDEVSARLLADLTVTVMYLAVDRWLASPHSELSAFIDEMLDAHAALHDPRAVGRSVDTLAP